MTEVIHIVLRYALLDKIAGLHEQPVNYVCGTLGGDSRIRRQKTKASILLDMGPC